MSEIKLIIAGIILVVLGLAAWGVKHAIDTFKEVAAENATLKLEKKELEVSLRETERTSGILFQVAKSNRGDRDAITTGTSAIIGELRALALSDPALRDRASRPVPDPVQQRLRKRAIDTDGYPAMQGSGSISGGDTGTGSKQQDRGEQGRDARKPAGITGALQR